MIADFIQSISFWMEVNHTGSKNFPVWFNLLSHMITGILKCGRTPFVPNEELFTGARSWLIPNSDFKFDLCGQQRTSKQRGIYVNENALQPYLEKPLLNLELLLKVSLPLMLLLLYRRDSDQNYDRLYCESQRCKESTTVALISRGISKNGWVVQPQFAYKGLERELG